MHKLPRSDESQRLPDRAFVLIASSINLPHRIADRKYRGMSGNGPFATCHDPPRMSASWGSPELNG